jgi:hypothetical protein
MPQYVWRLHDSKAAGLHLQRAVSDSVGNSVRPGGSAYCTMHDAPGRVAAHALPLLPWL